MRYEKQVRSGLWLSKWFTGRWQSPEESPWPGLKIVSNKGKTGFTVINASNNREIAYINLHSRAGEWYTTYRSLVKPSSFQKKDLQCMPIDMGKPKSNALTDCYLITKDAYSNYKPRTAVTKCQWNGGKPNVSAYGHIENQLPFLTYDSKGNWQDPNKTELIFQQRCLEGAESHSARANMDARWLHINASGMTAKQWYKNIFETLNKIKGCTVDKRRMLTLAARAYASIKKAAEHLPGSILHLIPMEYGYNCGGIDNLPFNKHGRFEMAEATHCLGTLVEGNYCSLPSIVLTMPKTRHDEEYVGHFTNQPHQHMKVSYDWTCGEVITIPPVGAINLTRRETTSIGESGMVRRTPNKNDRQVYEPHELDKLSARKDSALTKQELKDKYTAWDEPWRTCKVVGARARLKWDWGHSRDEFVEEDFRRLTKNGVYDSLNYQQEKFARSSLHDFSKDDEHVGVMAITESMKTEIPRAVKVKDLGSDLVASTIVNQLPLS